MNENKYKNKIEELKTLYPVIMSNKWQIGMRVFTLVIGVVIIVILTASLVI